MPLPQVTEAKARRFQTHTTLNLPSWTDRSHLHVVSRDSLSIRPLRPLIRSAHFSHSCPAVVGLDQKFMVIVVWATRRGWIKVFDLTRSGQLFVPGSGRVKWTGWTGQMGQKLMLKFCLFQYELSNFWVHKWDGGANDNLVTFVRWQMCHTKWLTFTCNFKQCSIMVLLKNHIASLKCAILSYLWLRGKLIYWKCDQCKHENIIEIQIGYKKKPLKPTYKQNL